MHTPHTSARYAVIFAEALYPGDDGYAVVAVHGLSETTAQVSPAKIARGGLWLGSPVFISLAHIVAMVPTSKAAFTAKGAIQDEDEEAERPVHVCDKHPDRQAVVSPKPGVKWCSECAIDWDRDEFNQTEARL